MTAYYNEFDKRAAAWLRELISKGLIADGIVDERSVLEVEPSDLEGFTQCHFFAGIGGWSYALRLSGWSDDRPVWTGSPPCQPFSVAGQSKGQDDERHLAPHFLELVNEGRPPILFGEQVASSAVFGKVTKGRRGEAASPPEWAWIDDVSSRLEAAHYAFAASDLPAAGVGAPHLRQRCFFGAVKLADGDGDRCQKGDKLRPICKKHDVKYGSGSSGVADAERTGPQGWSGPTNGFWRDADWLRCRDGKWRPVEPGTLPLAHGVSGKMGLLRGYGNAIVPQAASAFIESFVDALEDM